MAEDMERRRYALIGTGNRGTTMWGRDLLEGWRDKVELVAICDLNGLRAERARTMIGSNAPIYGSIEQTLAASQPADPQRVQLRLGRAAVKVDDARLAAAAFNKVYYEHPLTIEATEAREELDKLAAPSPPVPPTPERTKLDLARAERLYNAGRHADARKSFDALRGFGDCF